MSDPLNYFVRLSRSWKQFLSTFMNFQVILKNFNDNIEALASNWKQKLVNCRFVLFHEVTRKRKRNYTTRAISFFCRRIIKREPEECLDDIIIKSFFWYWKTFSWQTFFFLLFISTKAEKDISLSPNILFVLCNLLSLGATNGNFKYRV